MPAVKYSRSIAYKKKYFCIFENTSRVRKYLDLAYFVYYGKKNTNLLKNIKVPILIFIKKTRSDSTITLSCCYILVYLKYTDTINLFVY